jgi:hypothetical protein
MPPLNEHTSKSYLVEVVGASIHCLLRGRLDSERLVTNAFHLIMRPRVGGKRVRALAFSKRFRLLFFLSEYRIRCDRVRQAQFGGYGPAKRVL